MRLRLRWRFGIRRSSEILKIHVREADGAFDPLDLSHDAKAFVVPFQRGGYSAHTVIGHDKLQHKCG